MEFCPKCGSLLVPSKDEKKKSLVCSCGYITRGKKEIKLKEAIETSTEGEGVAESVEETASIADEECPKCSNNKAFWWTQQTRAADEPETQFFRCTKCKHTWREYA